MITLDCEIMCLVHKIGIVK
uniref:Uncharacterized protein n=1 Tax=Arundo donax TaxID=35708 RepID=A0A0A9A7F3_ARUDO